MPNVSDQLKFIGYFGHVVIFDLGYKQFDPSLEDKIAYDCRYTSLVAGII